MSYLSFLIVTSAPNDLRDFLVARGFMKVEDGQLVGVKPGVEWVKVPNPIVTSAGPPPVYDTRHCYMVKVAHEALADEIAGEVQDDRQIWQRTKLGKWIFNNSAAFDQTDAAGKRFRGRKVTNAPVWLVREDDAAQIGVWQ